MSDTSQKSTSVTTQQSTSPTIDTTQTNPIPTTNDTASLSASPQSSTTHEGLLRNVSRTPFLRCYTDFCVMMHNEKTLNSGKTWLPGFSAMHYNRTYQSSLAKCDVLMMWSHIHFHGDLFVASDKRFHNSEQCYRNLLD
jgi:hypothetical protein